MNYSGLQRQATIMLLFSTVLTDFTGGNGGLLSGLFGKGSRGLSIVVLMVVLKY